MVLLLLIRLSHLPSLTSPSPHPMPVTARALILNSDGVTLLLRTSVVTHGQPWLSGRKSNSWLSTRAFQTLAPPLSHHICLLSLSCIPHCSCHPSGPWVSDAVRNPHTWCVFFLNCLSFPSKLNPSLNCRVDQCRQGSKYYIWRE